MEQISVQEAHRLIEDEHVTVIDCRERYEWEESRIEGVRLIPLSEYEADPSLIERQERIIFQCAAGQRSQAAGAIYEQQYPGSVALNLDGGIVAWAENGFPVQVGPPSV